MILSGTPYMQELFIYFKPINGVQTQININQFNFYVSILNKSCSSKEDYYKDMTTKHINTYKEKEIKGKKAVLKQISSYH